MSDVADRAAGRGSDRGAHRAGAHVAGIVLAAGAGRRMGRPKALIPLAGQPLVVRAVAALADGGCDPVAVIIGAEADRVATVIDEERVTAAVVPNLRWADGMATSVAAGLGWARTTTAGAALILPVDTPGLGPAVIARLLARWQRADADPEAVLVATYQGQPRNPVLFGRERWSAVGVDLAGDEGARSWLRDHPDLVTHVECGDLGDPVDLDTPADLDQWAPNATTTT